jgi:hypothetical protein
MLKILILSCVFFLYSCDIEEDYSLQGKVQNYVTGESLKGVGIRIFDDYNPYATFFPCKEVSLNTQADSLGYFDIYYTTSCRSYFRLDIDDMNQFNKLSIHRLVINGFPDSKSMLDKQNDKIDEFKVENSQKDMLIELQSYINLKITNNLTDSLTPEYVLLPEFDLKIDTITTSQVIYNLFLEKFSGSSEILIKYTNDKIVRKNLDFDYFKGHWYTIEL